MVPAVQRPTKTELTFDVPSGGTDKADFRLESAGPPKKK